MFKRKDEDNRTVVPGGGGGGVATSCKGASKLNQVFCKLSSGILPKTQELGVSNGTKIMTSDIIESVLADSPVPQPPYCNYDLSTTTTSLQIDDNNKQLCLTIITLNKRLEMALRATKKTHLLCNEILLPCGLLYRISYDILSMAESEPCGIRGCFINLNFELYDLCRKLTTIKCDPHTATTFELNLTLKQQQQQHSSNGVGGGGGGWTTFVPQFLKNLTRGGAIIVSPAYTLSKKKLYRSVLD